MKLSKKAIVDRRLTKGELDDISKRITAIGKLFDQDLPDDVADTLEQELHCHQDRLEESLKLCQRAHLKIMK